MMFFGISRQSTTLLSKMLIHFIFLCRSYNVIYLTQDLQWAPESMTDAEIKAFKEIALESLDLWKNEIPKREFEFCLLNYWNELEMRIYIYIYI